MSLMIILILLVAVVAIGSIGIVSILKLGWIGFAFLCAGGGMLTVVLILYISVGGVRYMRQPAPPEIAMALPVVTDSETASGSQTPAFDDAEVPASPADTDTISASEIDPAVPAPDGNPSTIIEILRDESGQVISIRPLSEPPQWLKAPAVVFDHGRTLLTLHSQRFATLDEARQQLWPELKAAIIQELRRASPEVRDWPSTLAEMESAGVLFKECDVTSPLQVGDFQETVHQVHWQAQLTDQTRGQLAALWKPSLIRSRLGQLAVGFGTLMLLMSVGAFAFRRSPSDL